MKAVISINAPTITVLTATSLETRAARRAMPHACVEQVGVALAKAPDRAWPGAVISCGIAGALRNDVPTGTVLVPEYVGDSGGERRRCDIQIVAALVSAAQALGYEPNRAPMLTSRTIVRGAQRDEWARCGYASVDMETGLIDAARVAALRIVLDTPQHELAQAWISPRSALLHIECWKQLPWLMREAPRAARRAAHIVARMLESLA